MLNGWIISNLWDNFEPSDGCKKPGHVAGYVGQNNKYFSIDHEIPPDLREKLVRNI